MRASRFGIYGPFVQAVAASRKQTRGSATFSRRLRFSAEGSFKRSFSYRNL